MTAVRSSAIISLSFALVACGDGGGGIASAPTPLSAASSPIPTETRTPLPPTPAITTGTYDAIAAFGVHGEQTISNNAPAGSVQIAVDAATRSYTLTANVGQLQYPATTLRQLADTPLGYSENNSPAHGFSCAGD
ncbi:MAG: hypothetical protein ABIT09_11835, partial [Croceibacterium sp.]